MLAMILLASILGATMPPSMGASAQTPQPPPAVRSLLESMSPQERVGQLFLITFSGTDLGSTSPIYDLIVNRRIGGVVLSAANDNFSPAPATVPDAYHLIDDLQRLAWESSSYPAPDQISGDPSKKAYVPLFIGISQEGNGYPTDQLLSGLTPLPSEMAIGATWKPDLANGVGIVLGRELSALGINLYLGPSLDVLDSPNPSASGDLGTRVFGGDPYWVSEMGQAYISGLHSGSQGRMAVIAKHFPGRGDTDRLPEQEAATVRKSLEQMEQIDLAPFMAATGNAPTPLSAVNGLLVSHIRYQGFQGNIRATTRPISLDTQALAAILSLPQFAAWRQNGGLIISDDLGSRAVRDFYSPAGGDFPARLASRDAILAGNDLLYLGNIHSDDSSDNYATLISILDFFTQKYGEDPAFAQEVDASVARILSLKYQLYHGNLNYASVHIPQQRLNEIGAGQQATFDVARYSATLISPSAQDLVNVFASPPQSRDWIVFITDTLQARQCTTCPEASGLAVDSLEQVVLRLYGPESGRQTSDSRLSSYSLDDLRGLLDGGNPPHVESDISRASWVVISVADTARGQPQLISRLLSEREDLLADKHVILFSFGAPYYFDATDISKLTAYYCLYSRQPFFVEVAARLLFKEQAPLGESPVSVPGAEYDLITVTSPDPAKLIPLVLDLPPAGASAATPEAPPLFKIGDTIAIKTGIIYDHNGNPVPDGTVVHFSMVLTGEGGGIVQQFDAVTTQGVARASFGLDKPGQLEIHATSEPARLSDVLQLDVSSGQGAAVTVVVPLLTPPNSLPTAAAPSGEEDEFISSEGAPRISAWFLGLLVLLGLAALAYWAGTRLESARWGLRWGLCAALGGLGAYTYLALGLPGAARWLTSNGMPGVLTFMILGSLIGWGTGWYWLKRSSAL
jgi:beta-N-acetylhexosaminidase